MTGKALFKRFIRTGQGPTVRLFHGYDDIIKRRQAEYEDVMDSGHYLDGDTRPLTW